MTDEASLYGVRFDQERDRALEAARVRRAEAQVLQAHGRLIAAAVLLAAARLYDDSAQYWDEECRILREKREARDRRTAPSISDKSHPSSD